MIPRLRGFFGKRVWFYVALAAAATLAAAAWIRLGPIPADLLSTSVDASTVVVDRHGSPLYEARSSAGTRSSRLDAASLPQALINATLAAEDHRFFSHSGVDPLAIVRAVVRAFESRQNRLWVVHTGIRPLARVSLRDRVEQCGLNPSRMIRSRIDAFGLARQSSRADHLRHECRATLLDGLLDRV